MTNLAKEVAMREAELLGKRGITCVLVLAVFFIGSAWAAPAHAAEKPIKIGVILAQTGPFASLCKLFMDGFNLSVQSAENKVAGKAVEVIWDDEGPGDPTFTMDKMRKLVESDKVDVVVGPFNSDVRLATLAYTSVRKIPSFAVIADDAASLKFPYSYAYDQTTWQYPRPFAWYAFDKLNIKTINIFAGDWHAGRAMTDGFAYGFTKERGGKIVGQQFASLGTTDFSSYIAAMKPADAVLVFSVPGDTAAFLSQAHQMGLFSKSKILVLGGQANVFPSMLKDLGPALVGKTWGEAVYQNAYTDSVNKKFITDFEAKYGHKPLNMEGTGFMTGSVILGALKAAKGDTTPDKLHDAVKKLNLDTIQGKLAFTSGNPDKSGVQGVISRFIEEVKKGQDGQYFWDLTQVYPAIKPIVVSN